MPKPLRFHDDELADHYDLTDITFGAGDHEVPGIQLVCKACKADGKDVPRTYELELSNDDMSVRRGDRNSLLAHAKAHTIKPRLRRKAG